jgi:hypothetical protein
VYVTQEDTLLLTACDGQGSGTLTFCARILRADGQIIPHQFQLSMNAPQTVFTKQIMLPEGYLLACNLTYNNTQNAGTGCYAMLQIFSGSITGGFPFETVLAGYVFQASPLSFPEMAPRYGMDMAGYMGIIGTANPGAGNEILLTVPPTRRIRIKSFVLQLITSATVANRNPLFLFDDGAGNVFAEAGVNLSQPAGQNWRYTGYTTSPVELHTNATGTEVQLTIPDLWLPAGYRIRTQTQSLQAGDTYSNWFFFVEAQTILL